MSFTLKYIDLLFDLKTDIWLIFENLTNTNSLCCIMRTLLSFVYELILTILICFLFLARVLKSLSNLAPHHCCLFIGLFLSFCVFCVSISGEISPHDVIPHGAAAIVPVKLRVMYVMVYRSLIIPVTKSPVTLKREDDQPNGKSTKHVERSDQGHDWC